MSTVVLLAAACAGTQPGAGDRESLEPRDPHAAVAEAQRLDEGARQRAEAEEFRAAIALTEKALALRRRALGSRHPDVASTLRELAMLHSARGDYASAEPFLQQSLEITPHDGAAHEALGIVYGRTKRLKEAHGALTKATLFNSASAGWFALAATAAAKGTHSRAAALYRTGLRYYPSGPLADRARGFLDSYRRPTPAACQREDRLRCGWSRASEGDLDAAVRDWRTHLASHPDDAPVHASLGAALRRLGRHAESNAAWHRAIELHPSFACHRDALYLDATIAAKLRRDRLSLSLTVWDSPVAVVWEPDARPVVVKRDGSDLGPVTRTYLGNGVKDPRTGEVLIVNLRPDDSTLQDLIDRHYRGFVVFESPHIVLPCASARFFEPRVPVEDIDLAHLQQYVHPTLRLRMPYPPQWFVKELEPDDDLGNPDPWWYRVVISREMVLPFGDYFFVGVTVGMPKPGLRPDSVLDGMRAAGHRQLSVRTIRAGEDSYLLAEFLLVGPSSSFPTHTYLLFVKDPGRDFVVILEAPDAEWPRYRDLFDAMVDAIATS